MTFRIKRRWLAISFIAIIAAFSFQNCSPGFKVNLDPGSTALSSMDSTPLTSKVDCAKSEYGWSELALNSLPYGVGLGAYQNMVDSKNNYYIIGASKVGMIPRWVIYKSSDKGKNWRLVYTLANEDAGPNDIDDTYGHRLAIGENDNLYAIGAFDKRLIINKSTDFGETWNKIDEYAVPGRTVYNGDFIEKQTVAGKVILYTGQAYDKATGASQWFARRSADNGITWTNYDESIEAEVFHASPNSIAVDPAGNIIAVGATRLTSADTYKWRIRKSTDDGLTWTALGDEFQLAPNKPSFSYWIHSHKGGSGNSLFIGGRATDANNVNHTIIRRSFNNGATWSTVEDQIGGGAYKVFGDQSGNLYYVSSSLNSVMTIRKSIDNGNTWFDFDTISVPAGRILEYSDIRTDSDGNIIVTGYSYDVGNYANKLSVFRKLSGRFPTQLSQTCLYEDKLIVNSKDNVYEYSPKYPLWSDGAEKRRWIYLPPNKQIDTSNMSSWNYPVGTKLWKEFVIQGKKIETRLISKVREGFGPKSWEFATYKWNEEQTEANIIFKGEDDVHGTPLNIPNSNMCMRCHQGSADFVLGFDALQLSQPNSTQYLNLAKLKEKNLLSNPPFAEVEIPGSAVDKAAIGYVHINCGTCHNPLGSAAGVAGMSLRHNYNATTLEESNLYMSTVNKNGFGGLKIASPQDLQNSRMILRMSTRGAVIAPAPTQMPPIATEIVDPVGLKSIQDWILSLPVL
jgi:hypothetical protein